MRVRIRVRIRIQSEMWLRTGCEFDDKDEKQHPAIEEDLPSGHSLVLYTGPYTDRIRVRIEENLPSGHSLGIRIRIRKGNAIRGVIYGSVYGLYGPYGGGPS